ncbi:hypothetical protein J5N97_002914 [Dioscorea zingiberensis]|uniref:LisH domain-containing protein n=1 Tax=Dioscorea zingiberensis TaxID=325984 RepID=A0A9D5HPX9_9LILI|nr:hypothetical protein J5N97_002914 [Dioscorea zingiberensis]
MDGNADPLIQKKSSAGGRVQISNPTIHASGGEPRHAGSADPLIQNKSSAGGRVQISNPRIPGPSSPVRNLEELSSNRLILFPNVKLGGNLTEAQLNVLIFKYLRESGFPHTAFNFESEAELKHGPIDKSTIPRGTLRTFVLKGLRFTQLQANLHASNVDRILFSPLDPLDIITNRVPRLGDMIEENAKRKRNNDGGEGAGSGVAGPMTRSNKQKIAR